MTEKSQVLEACQKMYRQRFVAGTSGNISIRKKHKDGSQTFVIKPSSVPYDLMKEEDIVEIDQWGNPTQPGKRPSSEWKMHVAIYLAYPEINAVVHTHSPFATGFAVSRQSIPLILIEMTPFLGGAVPITPFAPAGSEELGNAILPFLKDRTACLLANHGVVAIGKDLISAYIAAEYVEDAAKIYYYAKTSGTPVIIDED